MDLKENFHDRVIEACAAALFDAIENLPGQTLSELRENRHYSERNTILLAIDRLLDRHQIKEVHGKYYV